MSHTFLPEMGARDDSVTVNPAGNSPVMRTFVSGFDAFERAVTVIVTCWPDATRSIADDVSTSGEEFIRTMLGGISL